VLAQQLGLGFSKAHRLAAAGLELSHQDEEEDEQEDHRQEVHRVDPEVVRLLLLDSEGGARVMELLDDGVREDAGAPEGHATLEGALEACGAGNVTALDDECLDL